MQVRFLFVAFLTIGMTSAWGAEPAAQSNAPSGGTPAPAVKAPPPPIPEQLATLPGNGLKQHDFLYTGEFDTRKKEQTISLIRGGKVVWTYTIPTNDQNKNLSEYSDMHMLSNGDVVFAYKTGWRKVNQAKETIFDFQCPKETGPDGKTYWRECHTAQPIGNDKVMYMLNGLPAKLYIYNIKTGKIEMEHVMKTKNPEDPKSIHGQFRNVRMIKGGNYLISHLDLGKVIEYDKDWNEVWSCDAPSVWHAVRLKNGNTLIAGNQHAFAREVNPKGEIVWEYKNGDTPGVTLFGVHQAIRLQNGNTVLCNWCAGRVKNKAEWPNTIQAVEVTPDKKIAWALREWTAPDLGTCSCIQMLDEPGNAEDMDLQR
jgi:hypothetical protein